MAVSFKIFTTLGSKWYSVPISLKIKNIIASTKMLFQILIMNCNDIEYQLKTIEVKLTEMTVLQTKSKASIMQFEKCVNSINTTHNLIEYVMT